MKTQILMSFQDANIHKVTLKDWSEEKEKKKITATHALCEVYKSISIWQAKSPLNRGTAGRQTFIFKYKYIDFLLDTRPLAQKEIL